MPLIDAIAILDVNPASHRILLNKNSRPYTAFSTAKEHYQFRCTPFRLQHINVQFISTIYSLKNVEKYIFICFLIYLTNFKKCIRENEDEISRYAKVYIRIGTLLYSKEYQFLLR